MTKNSYIFFSICTFGILPLIVNKKAKLRANNVNQHLTYSSIVDFDINQFFNFLGNKINIISCSATLNTLTVAVRNPLNITPQVLTTFKIRGFSKSVDNKFIFIFGNNALTIKSKLDNLLK
ncbi:MAG: PTS sugar transporter subunit IIA [Mycoplasmataceae bacterium]|nr:PTS sugar transporter subunit IIA [Mycoplasmataceae bacterium]